MSGMTRGIPALGGGSGGSSSTDVFLKKTVSVDVIVPADCVLLLHNALLADGVTITVEDTGEVLVL